MFFEFWEINKFGCGGRCLRMLESRNDYLKIRLKNIINVIKDLLIMEWYDF